MDKLRILVVDDHDDFRRGLRALLAATESLEVVGVATNGATAVSMALDLQPDVVAHGPAHAASSTASRPPSGSCAPPPTSASWW